MLNINLLVVVAALCITGGARADLADGVQTTPTAAVEMEKLHIAHVSEQNICQRMSDELTRYGVSIGLDKSKSQIYALESTQRVIANFRLGDRHEFVDMHSLPFHRDINPKPENNYLNLAGILGNSLGIKGRLLLGFDVNELRFLPQVQVGSEIIMIVRTTEGMTSARARTIVELAKKLDVKISIVWVGLESTEAGASFDGDALAFLAAVTGGTYADLGGNRAPCAQIL